MVKNFLCLFAGLLFSAMVFAQTTDSVDLSTWVSEGGNSSWNVFGGNDAVLQTINGDPTIFYDPSNTSSQGMALNGNIRVTTTDDNDFIGFVLGYDAGEINSGSANFFLIDWKQQDQAGVEDSSLTGYGGISISHITDARLWWDDFWAHLGGVNEIQRGSSLGSTGWEDDREYSFNLVFTSDMIDVRVDGVGELSITPADVGLSSFEDGSFGFYNMSQSHVLYSAIRQVDCAENPTAPECATAQICDLQIEQSVEVLPGDGGGGVVNCGYPGAPRPESLSFQYTGGGCGADTSTCSCRGEIDSSKPISVLAISGIDHYRFKTVHDGYIVTPTGNIAPGEVFTLTVDVGTGEIFDTETVMKLVNDWGRESHKIHTSCSRPLAVGDVFGSLTLVAINGLDGSVGTADDLVNYQYLITNNGSDVNNVRVTDDDTLHLVGEVSQLLSGESAAFTYQTDTIETLVSVTGDLNGTQDCSDKTFVYDSDSDGILDDADNCLLIVNPDQADSNGDGVGDACERDVVIFDTDGDSVLDDIDNCPFIGNLDQIDTDGDLIGDACDVSSRQPVGCNTSGGNYDLLLMLLLICTFSYGRDRWVSYRVKA